MLNVNDPTDRYFKNADYEIKGTQIARSANGSCDLVRSLAFINPLDPDIAYSRNLGTLKVPAQLQKRRFYFGLVIDQVQNWLVDAEIIFSLNNSPVFTWPLHFRDAVSRNIYNPNALQVTSNDTVNPPYWVDVQRLNPATNPLTVAQTQQMFPGNESLNMSPLASCDQILAPNNLWFNFSARQLQLDTTVCRVYYTISMFPTQLDLMCDKIELQLTRGKFFMDIPDVQEGFVLATMACYSSRY